jgi:uncharacterized protein YjbJ (UPF0337 family)
MSDRIKVQCTKCGGPMKEKAGKTRGDNSRHCPNCEAL